MEWWERFKELREKHGLSKTEIAAQMGKDSTQISRYESGRGAKTITRTLRADLEKVFSPEEIHYIEKGESAAVEEPAVRYGRRDEIVAIPALEVRASAGEGNNIESVDDFPAVRTLEVDRGLFRTDPRNLRAIRVDGYSMVPVLLPESWVFFEPTQEWSGDGLYVLVFRGVLMVKQVEADPRTGNLWIKSANRDYESWEYDPRQEQSTMRIVGRVVRVMV